MVRPHGFAVGCVVRFQVSIPWGPSDEAMAEWSRAHRDLGNVLDAASRRQPDLIVYPDTVVCLAEFPRTFVVSQEAFRVLVGSLQERGLRN
jgi:hypothetical protein